MQNEDTISQEQIDQINAHDEQMRREQDEAIKDYRAARQLAGYDDDNCDWHPTDIVIPEGCANTATASYDEMNEDWSPSEMEIIDYLCVTTSPRNKGDIDERIKDAVARGHDLVFAVFRFGQFLYPMIWRRVIERNYIRQVLKPININTI